MSENQHLSSQFDADLDAVCTRVLYMGGLVERQINQAIEGMSNGDLDLLQRVSIGDQEVNAALDLPFHEVAKRCFVDAAIAAKGSDQCCATAAEDHNKMESTRTGELGLGKVAK